MNNFEVKNVLCCRFPLGPKFSLMLSTNRPCYLHTDKSVVIITNLQTHSVVEAESIDRQAWNSDGFLYVSCTRGG